MNRLLRTGSGVVFALLTVAGLLSVGVGGAAATGNPPTFTVSVLPGSLTVGNSGVVQGTFTNNGTAVSGVAFTFTFPFALHVPAANGCASVPLLPRTVACLVGLVPAGATASKSFEFTVPEVTGAGSPTGAPLTVAGIAGWLSPRPPLAGLAKANGLATIYDAGSLTIPLATGFTQVAGASDCVGQGGSVNGTALAGTEGPVVTAGPNSSGLPCTPIVAGVVTNGDSDQFVAKLPLGTTAQVTLNFVDDTLPFSGDGPVFLNEYPNYPDLSTDVHVPACNPSGTIPSPAAEGYSSDACIVSVTPTDTEDNDADAGYIVLNVVGTAGDGAFHGG